MELEPSEILVFTYRLRSCHIFCFPNEKVLYVQSESDRSPQFNNFIRQTKKNKKKKRTKPNRTKTFFKMVDIHINVNEKKKGVKNFRQCIQSESIFSS